MQDFPKVVIAKARRGEHKLYRVAADGVSGRHVIIALFPMQMPDEVVLMWVRGLTFYPLQ